jgi:glycosyltransferase involved in cell wall biosynthesis
MHPSEKRKILFFQHSNHNGGAPRSLKQIVTAYEQEFGPQTVLFIRPGPVLETYSDVQSQVICGRFLLPFHGSEVSGMPWKMVIRNLLGLFVVPFGYFKYLRGYDVIYLNSSALCFYGFMIKTFSPRTRVICHIREPLLKSFWGAVIRTVLRKGTDQVIAISKNELENLGLPGVDGSVVYNYVHSHDYQVEQGQSLHRQDSAVGKSKFVVGYFARVDEKNGIADFLEVAKRHEADPDIAFCVYGYTGQEKGNVQSLITSAGPNIHVYPMVSDVPKNLTDIDLLLVPFKSPHFSRSVVEAAMLGTPSVIYDIVSVNETVRDNETGYVVPLGDIDKMAQRVGQLKADPELYKRLSEGAHAFAMDSFSEKNYARIRDAIHEKTTP